MANKKEGTIDFKTLAAGMLRFISEAAASPPWLKKLETGLWPKAEIPEVDQLAGELSGERSRAEQEIEGRYKERRDEVRRVVELRRKRLEAYAKRRRKVVPAEKDKFIVAGQVMDRATGVGLPNVKVNAFDLDRKYDDLLGDTRTDALGYFRLEYTAKEFKDFGDKFPETYIEVMGEDGVAVFTSTKSFVQKAGKTEFIDAAIEGEKVPASLALGGKISRSVNERLKGFERRERILARGAARLKVEKEEKGTASAKKKVSRGKAAGKK